MIKAVGTIAENSYENGFRDAYRFLDQPLSVIDFKQMKTGRLKNSTATIEYVTRRDDDEVT